MSNKAFHAGMPNYVLGFFFSPDTQRVLLILKNRPAFLAGLLNGIGGAVENNEGYPAAMEREFEEETGIHVDWQRWVNFCSMNVTFTHKKGNYYVECYKAIAESEYEFNSFKTTTDERVYAVDVKRLDNVVKNLTWMIPLALNGNIIRSSAIYQREDKS